jgi:hypothetical protein
LETDPVFWAAADSDKAVMISVANTLNGEAESIGGDFSKDSNKIAGAPDGLLTQKKLIHFAAIAILGLPEKRERQVHQDGESQISTAEQALVLDGYNIDQRISAFEMMPPS